MLLLGGAGMVPAAIIADFPWLAPAISEEEIESILRRMADGSAFGVDIEGRTDRLRAVGNGVCPLQAAAAFTVLAGGMTEAGRAMNG